MESRVQIRRVYQESIMKKGFTCGVFDLFHAGHVLMLQECKKHCDFLVVAINTCESIDLSINPNKTKPLFTFEQRKLIIEACKYVDKVIGYENELELEEIMRKGDYSVRFLGEDYKGKPISGAEAIKKVIYTDRSHGLSSTYFKTKLKDSYEI
jgi:glycerol-3-phosphate cytidylyltransferase